MATQLDIANRLSLSTATVSRALAGHDDRKPETRARVLEMAAQLGYPVSNKSNRAAHSSALEEEQRDATVLLGVFVVMTGTTRPVPLVTVRLLRGMAKACRHTPVALHTDYVSPEEMNRIAAGLNEGHMKGTLLLGHFPSDTVKLVAQQLPCVRISFSDPSVRLDCIGQAEPDAMAQLFEHLLSLGHRRIGFFGSRHPIDRARFGTYAQYQAERERFPDEADVIDVLGEPLGDAELAQRLVQQFERGTRAWICANDNYGYRIVRLLRERGLRVPEEVSVCGFDRLDPPPGLPNLTSIEWPFEEMGAAAVQRMLLRIKTPAGAKRQVVFSGSVAEGLSTGPLSS